MLEHLELLQVPGKRFFLLFYRFLLKPNTAWFCGEAAAATSPRRKGWTCPQPQATEESLGQGEMTPKQLWMMKCPDSFETLILKKGKRLKR